MLNRNPQTIIELLKDSRLPFSVTGTIGDIHIYIEFDHSHNRWSVGDWDGDIGSCKTVDTEQEAVSLLIGYIDAARKDKPDPSDMSGTQPSQEANHPNGE